MPPSKNRGRLKGALLVAFVALCVLSAISITQWLGNSDGTSGTGELKSIAASFPAPVGAVTAAPDVVGDNGDDVLRTWTATGTVDQACQAWRDAYRTWIGTVDLGSVSGQAVPGQSCTYRGVKQGHQVTLTVAVYAGAAPQATLALKR